MWTKRFAIVLFWMLFPGWAAAQLPSDTSQQEAAPDCSVDVSAPECLAQEPATTPIQIQTPTPTSGEGDTHDLNTGTQTTPEKAPPSTDRGSQSQETQTEGATAGTEQAQENVFQRFVQIAIGTRLPIFGEALFRNSPSTFAPAERIPITGNYVVGPGDELLVNVWGQITLTARLKVDREGNIQIPHVGPVNVAGVKYDELHDRLTNAIAHYYKNFQLSVSLGRLRSIQIYVTGFARQPGNYTVSSLTTLVDALFDSGGPAPQGSMRTIQLKRAGQVVTQFDLYDFLLHGDSSKDVPLQAEDVVYIPPVGPLVAMAGSVHVPAIYEAKKGSTLADAIAVAGGLSTVADGSRVMLERVDKRSGRSVQEVALDQHALALQLRDGDIVRVLALSPKIENAIILRGNVANPGRYPYRQGMRVHDLIPSREALLTPDFWKAQVAVTLEDPYALPQTRSTMRTTAPPGPTQDNNLPATQNNRTTQKMPQSISTQPPQQTNAVRLSAPEINWDYAVIQRLNPVDLTTRLVPFNLGKALAGDEDANVALMPGDVVTIFSQRDIAVPRDERTRFVTVEGEVRAAGVYRLEPGDTLRSLLRRAGGLTDKAYLFGTLMTRESAREEQQQMLDETTQSISAQVQQRASSDTVGHPEDAASITAWRTGQLQLLAKMRGIRASGRVVLEIKPSDKTIDDLPDVPLEDGDRISIPQELAMVNVVGAVYRQSSFVYVDGTNVRHYLRLAGSATQTADLKHALLVRADGSVVDRRSTSRLWRGGFYDVRVLPGDTLVIPTKLVTGAFQRNLRDWTQIASQMALAGASLAVIAGL